MRFWRRKRVERVQEINELPLTPLIDTAFTLLIIFMVTAPMMQNSLKISLPKTKSAASSSNMVERLIVSVDASGKIFVGEDEVSASDLVKVLKTKVVSAADKVVLVNADKTLMYDKVIQIIDLVSGVEGVQHVALAAELASKKL
jgi:biopolymer transport protein ExbD